MVRHLIELREVRKSYGNVFAVGGVSLHVAPGEVVGLLGDNGAGKSVLVKTIAGIHEADGGEIFWEGKPVHIGSPRDSAALGALMNTRGLMELIVLNIGLDLGIISPTLFAMMVVMALATTAPAAPYPGTSHTLMATLATRATMVDHSDSMDRRVMPIPTQVTSERVYSSGSPIQHSMRYFT